MTAPTGPSTPSTTTRSGKSNAVQVLIAEILSGRNTDLVLAGPAKGLPLAGAPADEQDDVALDDVLVLGVRLADLRPDELATGSPAWNAVHARQLADEQPWARGHFEQLAREWADCANTLAEQGRGRDQ